MPDSTETPALRPFQRRPAGKKGISPAEARGQRLAADPLPAVGRPASLIREVEALLAKNPRPSPSRNP